MTAMNYRTISPAIFICFSSIFSLKNPPLLFSSYFIYKKSPFFFVPFPRIILFLEILIIGNFFFSSSNVNQKTHKNARREDFIRQNRWFSYVSSTGKEFQSWFLISFQETCHIWWCPWWLVRWKSCLCYQLSLFQWLI